MFCDFIPQFAVYYEKLNLSLDDCCLQVLKTGETNKFISIKNKQKKKPKGKN